MRALNLSSCICIVAILTITDSDPLIKMIMVLQALLCRAKR